jgi:ABC-type uncharacterized transport system substrate-binding protein
MGRRQLFKWGLLAAAAAAWTEVSAAARIAVVLEARDAASAPVLAALDRSAGPDAALVVHELRKTDVADPIQKGRLLAVLGAADLVVPVGDRATEFVLGEMEDARVFFIGAGLVRGAALASPDVAGILAYNAEEVLDLVKTLRTASLGVAYTPGYESVAERIAQAGAARGIRVVKAKAGSLPEVAASVRKLTEETQAIWALGDPLLVRGAGFQFLVERSLSRALPLIGSSAWEVKRGALLCLEPSAESLAARAGPLVAEMMARRAPSEKLTLAPAGGTFIVNEKLAEKWTIAMPGTTRWRPAP